MENNIRDFINEETGASTLEVALLLLDNSLPSITYV